MTKREQEKMVELQKLFDGMNRNGSFMLWLGTDTPGDMGIVDCWEVTRVLEKDGKFLFWLLFRFPGFQDDIHFIHTILVKSWSQGDGYELDIIDSEDRHFHLEEFIDGTEEFRHKGWKNWVAFRDKNQDLINKGWKETRQAMIETANTWTTIP